MHAPSFLLYTQSQNRYLQCDSHPTMQGPTNISTSPPYAELHARDEHHEGQQLECVQPLEVISQLSHEIYPLWSSTA